MSVITRPAEETPFGAILLYAFCGLSALVSLAATAYSSDPLFRLQGWIFTGTFVAAGLIMSFGMTSGWFRNTPDRYEDGVIRAGVIATMFWGVVGMLVGVVIASQLSWPNLLYFP